MDAALPAPDTDAHLAEIVRACRAAVISADLQRRILSWNPGATKLFGLPEEEMLDADLRKIVPDPGVEEFTDLFHQAERGGNLIVEMMVRHRSGARLPARLSLSPLRTAGGQIAGVCLVVQEDETRSTYSPPPEPRRAEPPLVDRQVLERALLEATERESRRIGQELHDHFCQHLLGAAFSAKAISQSLPEDSQVSAQLDELAHLINAAVHQAREIARGLNPVELEADGLAEALQNLVARHRPGVLCRLECERPVRLRDAEAARHAYRIAQEAVAGAVEHARATEVTIRLSEDHGQVLLEIADNGPGDPDGEDLTQARGFDIIRCRGQAIGGTVRIDTAKSGGTSVTCLLTKE